MRQGGRKGGGEKSEPRKATRRYYRKVTGKASEMYLEAHFGDIVGSVPDRHTEVNSAVKGVTWIFVSQYI